MKVTSHIIGKSSFFVCDIDLFFSVFSILFILAILIGLLNFGLNSSMLSSFIAHQLMSKRSDTFSLHASLYQSKSHTCKFTAKLFKSSRTLRKCFTKWLSFRTFQCVLSITYLHARGLQKNFHISSAILQAVNDNCRQHFASNVFINTLLEYV